MDCMSRYLLNVCLQLTDCFCRYSEYWGARTWYNPGAFSAGFPGFCSVFVTAAFSFSGTELVGLAAAESKNPQKALPGAIKQIFWRITLFYILALFFVGLLVPWDDERLLGSNDFIDVSASPFVIAAVNAGIPAFGDFVNVVILFSVVSIGLSGVYGGSRTLTAMAEQGYAPGFFAYIDRAGRPLFSTIAIIAFGPLAYMTLSTGGVVAFNWLVALSGLAALFTWGSICFAHIRFRAAWKYHGHTEDELPFKALFGVWGSWVGLGLVVIVLIAQVSIIILETSFTDTDSTFAVLRRGPRSFGLRLLPSIPRLLRRDLLLRDRLAVEARRLEEAQGCRCRLWTS